MAIANLPSHVHTLTVEVLDGAGKVLATGVAQNIQITPNATINVSVATSDAGSSAGLDVKVVVAPVTDTGSGKKTDPVLTQEEKAQSLIGAQNALAPMSKALTQFETEKARISQCGPRPQQPLPKPKPPLGGCGPGSISCFAVIAYDPTPTTDPAEMVRYRESFTSWEACVKKDSVIAPEGEGDKSYSDGIANGLPGFDPAHFIDVRIAMIKEPIWKLERVMAALKNSTP